MKKEIMNAVNVLVVLVAMSISSMALADSPTAKGLVVNINTATQLELAFLPGVGEATAERIVQYRKAHPFEKPIHLTRVKGIGSKTYKKMEPYVVVQGQTTAAAKLPSADKRPDGAAASAKTTP